MAIFHSYVSLPEGIHLNSQKKNGISPVAPVSVAQGSASKASLEVGAVVAREADLG